MLQHLAKRWHFDKPYKLILLLRFWRVCFLFGAGLSLPNMMRTSSSGKTGLAGTNVPAKLISNAECYLSRGNALLETAR